MKLNKTIVRILAVVMTVAMCASLFGCVSSYRNNPVVAKVGDVKLDLNQYLTLYNNTDSNNMYYTYLQYGIIDRAQYAQYILDDLVNYGVQLNQVGVQNITLDEAEEEELKSKVDDQIKSYLDTNYASKIDSAITDAAEKYNAELELLKKDLTDNGNSFENYRKNVEDSIRNTMLISKLHDVNVADVTVSNDDVKTYFKDNAKTDVTPTNFNTAFSNFVTAQSENAPLYMPHPERAVEDDPETTDVVETMPANPYGEFFSVQHDLMKFKTEAGDGVTDLAAYAADDADLVKRMEDLEAELPNMTTQQFFEKCHNSETCDDPGMLRPANQYFGYMMQESLIDSYFKGFGYAAMKLKFGEEWEPKADTETKTDESSESTPAEPEKYDVQYFTLSDGAKVAKVFTTSGVHYIIINPNDCFSMYDDDGYLMVPLYDGDQLVTDAEGIVTANGGHMTQEQLDAVNEILTNVSDKAKVEEDNTEDNTDDTAADDKKDDDEEAEEPKIVTLKSIYDACREAKLTAMQSEAFTAKFNEWKENTKIVTHKNLLKSFQQLG